uniref:SOSS complex subunit C n=1 Tax=Molossus molossus TaxID=27622 RepID=A0A7J8EE28_MOLMO|nr:INTS3 and NABP interacting protein [Molossus molossus]
MAANPSGQGFQNKNRVAILAELDKEKRKLLMQNQSSTNHPGASIALSRPSLNKDFRDHAEQQHIAAQQKAALQVSKVSLTFLSHWRVLGLGSQRNSYFVF